MSAVAAAYETRSGVCKSDGAVECGKVLFFSAAKGYGRIERSCGGSVFFSVQDLAEPGAHLDVGDKVEFEVTMYQNGRSKAIMVRHVT